MLDSSWGLGNKASVRETPKGPGATIQNNTPFRALAFEGQLPL